jgi:PncC family amidohydrolase
MEKMKKVVDRLIEKNKTISSMESCTGGGFANMITNIPGASDVFKFSAVTYSNEFKIRMGVDSEIIDKYSVYSIECAKSMSKNISDFTDSSYGVGITGKINRADKNNMNGSDNLVYVSIYDRDLDKYYTMSIDTIDRSREENKRMIIRNIVELLLTII